MGLQRVIHDLVTKKQQYKHESPSYSDFTYSEITRNVQVLGLEEFFQKGQTFREVDT